jgi:uncharacterized damage-inducible protein DinB
MYEAIIDHYEAGPEKLKGAVSGLSREDMLWKPQDPALGLWSMQQIVLHLLDADLIWCARMKSIISEENPTILGYDESKFADRLLPEARDAANALRLFELNRRQFAKVLRKLSESAFSRTGTHNERGTITLGQSLQWATEHVDHHVAFIRRKRDKLGKLWKES